MVTTYISEAKIVANPEIIEGTWAEIVLRANESPRGQQFRLVPIVPRDAPAIDVESSVAVSPNVGMLQALGEIDKRQEGRRSISGEDTQQMLRRARARGIPLTLVETSVPYLGDGPFLGETTGAGIVQVRPAVVTVAATQMPSINTFVSVGVAPGTL